MIKPYRFVQALACALGLTLVVHADPLGSAFTYQGQLATNTNAANGDYDFKFVLYGALEGGTGSATNIVRPVGVTNGYFTATLDFGADLFDGTARWLEIGVRHYSTNRIQLAYTVLAPRQALAPMPYALYATTAGSVSGSSNQTFAGNLSIDTSLSVGCPNPNGPNSKVTLTALQGNGSVSPADNTAIYAETFADNGRGVVGAADSGTAAKAVTGRSAEGIGGYFTGGTYGIQARGSGYAGQFDGHVRVSADYASAPAKPQLELSDSQIDGMARLRLNRGGAFWDIANRTDVNGNALRFYSSDSQSDVLTVHTNGDVVFGGESTMKALTITGGADVAEPFRMTEPSLPKGSVVIIDERHPGQLKRSERAYDTRVAGVVSGANGIHPGLSLSQQGALEGGQNVALSGRVYVQADASHGRIQPGDLLTTSDLTGHAMPAGDPRRAPGAIRGKAMSALDAGQGLVLVLVTLQ